MYLPVKITDGIPTVWRSIKTVVRPEQGRVSLESMPEMRDRMHKKRNLIMILSMLCVVYLLTGCGMVRSIAHIRQNRTEAENVENTADEEDTEPGTETGSDSNTEPGAEGSDTAGRSAQELVKDAFTRAETVELMDYPVDVDYHVPEILSDSEGAKEINRDILNVCQDVMQQLDEESFAWNKVGYEAYRNGDILSLLVTKYSIMDDYTLHYTYNLNLESGKRMDQKELIETLDFETRKGESVEAAVLRHIRREAAYASDLDMKYFFESVFFNQSETQDKQEMYAQYLLMRMETLQEDNIHLGLPMYLDGQGILQVAVPVYVMAGGGLYDHILSPMTEHDRADRELSFDQAVSVTYRDGRMTVRIDQSDWTNAAFGLGNLEFGKEYEVHGIYKDYTDAAMLPIMNGEYVVPVFVSEDGMVSYLDLYSCAEAGYFCITEPVCGLTNVEAVTESSANEIAAALEQFIFEQSPDFSRVAMGLYEGEGFSTGTTFHTDGGTQYTDSYYLGFDSEREGRFLYQISVDDVGIYFGYEGKCTYLGMNESGMIFACLLYEQTDGASGEAISGAFLERRRNDWNEKTMEWREWADYRLLNGYDLFGTEGDLRELEISAG